MAREGIIGWGSRNNDWRLHRQNGVAKVLSGWTFPTQTDDAVDASTFGGSRWIRADNAGGAGSMNLGRTDEAVTPKDYQWICQHPFRLSGTLGSSDQDKFLEWGLNAVVRGALEWDYVSSSTFKILFKDTFLRGTSSSTFDTDTSLDIRIEISKANNTFKMWVNGNLEIDISYGTGGGRYIDDARITLYPPTAANQEHYWGFGSITQSNSESDRCDTVVEMYELQSADNWAPEQEYGDETDCTPGSVDADYTDVLLDGSDEIIEGSGWCEQADEAGKQMSEMENLPSGFAGTILGVYWHTGMAAFFGGKNCDTYARIHDGTSGAEKANASLGSTSVTNRQHFFRDPPGAATWEDVIKTASSTFRAGIHSVNSNNDNDGVLGMVCAVYAVGDDPPSAAPTWVERSYPRGVGRGILEGVT